MKSIKTIALVIFVVTFMVACGNSGDKYDNFLDDYENYVDDYIELIQEVNGDMAALATSTKYMDMMETAQEMEKSMKEWNLTPTSYDVLTSEQQTRFLNILQKMSKATLNTMGH